MSTVARLKEVIGFLSPNDARFASSLIEAACSSRGASDKQWTWIETLTARGEGAKQAREDRSHCFEGIARLLTLARERGVTRAAIRLRLPDSQGAIIIRMGRDAIYVSDKDRMFTAKDGNEYRKGYGTIAFDGVFERSRYADLTILPAVLQTLEAFNNDPRKAGALEGHATGHCCFCGRRLDTAASVHAGYGPICATRFGLPWGEGSAAMNLYRAVETIR